MAFLGFLHGKSDSKLVFAWVSSSSLSELIMDAMDQIVANEVNIDVRNTETQRKSVFDRLDVDERLKIPGNNALNFAKAVGEGDGGSSLTFYPLVDKCHSRVRIPEVLAKQVLNQHRSTLIGYFLGPRLHFPLVEEYVKKVWGKFGFAGAMMNSNGIFFFKFNDVGGANQVVEAGHVMIRGVPLFVSHWDPSKGNSKPVHNTCPLWVKLHNVPLVAFNKEGIGRIASALGIPKQMDACTSSMCDRAWGRPGFAKVLVEVWAVGDLKREVQVVIPNVNGGDDVTVIVQVEYMWEPSQCNHCMVFGHKASACVKAVQTTKPKEKDTDDQGFITVKHTVQNKDGMGASKTKSVTSDLSGKEKQLKLKGILKHKPLIPDVSESFKTFQPRRGVVINEPSKSQQNRFSSLSDFSEDDISPILEQVIQDVEIGGMNDEGSIPLESTVLLTDPNK
ncbi:hypothetical protein OSB04_un000589 [Centaurea solstitialis]|uniref:DUF4283 domain-containing protein n=1 Tax=Centaurea solstitialis TaxID=347529 RepID=A0AA38W2H2_9ASTR|nr:hypothetical protein OSB04_un000589 [Centaurea solstitialis]